MQGLSKEGSLFHHNKDRACLCLNKLAVVKLEKVPEYSV